MLGWEIGSVSLSVIMIMKATWANQLTLLGTIPHYVRQVLYFPKVAVTKVESRFQPLRGDPDNPLKGKKGYLSGTQPTGSALRTGPEEELSLVFFAEGGLSLLLLLAEDIELNSRSTLLQYQKGSEYRHIYCLLLSRHVIADWTLLITFCLLLPDVYKKP